MSTRSILPLLLLACFGCLFATGCTAPAGPRDLVIQPDRYDACFDAAVEVARTHGLTAVRRDRRNGVIETEPRAAATMLEPWRTDNASFAQALENTVNYQQRRVRFEFFPAGDEIAALAPLPPQGELTGPDYSGVMHAPVDLTGYDGPIRVMCVVTVERYHRPGTRPATWSNRRLTTQTVRGDVDSDLPRTFWTPVSRDEAYEARLLERVHDLLSN